MESYCFGKYQQGSIWHGSTNWYQKLLQMFPVAMWDLTAGLAGGCVLDPLDSQDHQKPCLMDVH